MLTTAAKVRQLAIWPSTVTDDMLALHLASAARDLRRWMRSIDEDLYDALIAADDDDADRLAAEEIEGCLTIAYALPPLNSFVMADAPSVPKRVEDAEFQFLDHEQAEKLAASWRDRAEKRFASWDWTDEGEEETGEAKSPWYAV